MTRIFSAALIYLCLGAITQEPAPPSEPARVEVKLASKKSAPGGTIKGNVTVTFAPGWHGYQNPPTHEFEIPLKVSTSTKGVSLKATYPKGVMKEFSGEMTAMYEGAVGIPVVLTMPKKRGEVSIVFDVGYQQCNSSSCLPPEKASASVKVTVAARNHKLAKKR